MKRWTLVGCSLAGMLAATPAQAEIVIGPRFSYYFDNSNLRTSDLQGLQDARTFVDDELTQRIRDSDPLLSDLTVLVQDNGSALNSDQVGFPMIGGMVNFGDDRDRFTLIGMVGKGTTVTELVSSRSVEIQVGDIGIPEISVIQTISNDKIDRVDLEATWQRRLNENFAISAGLRYERLDVSGQGVVTIQETDAVRQFVAEALGEELPSRNLDGARQPARIATENTLETYTARAGVTAFVPFSNNANAFFSGMVQFGYQPDSTFKTDFFGVNNDLVRSENRTDAGETSIGPDFAVGAQFTIIENLALDIRYRAILFFPLSGDFSFGDSRVNHGVNVGLSLRL